MVAMVPSFGSKDNRHGGAGRDHRGGAPKGRGRGDFSKGDREQRHVVAAPEGVKARIMPIEEGLDAMAKQISATGERIPCSIWRGWC